MIGGIHAGYNYQIQSFVIGAETDINWTSIKGDDGGAGGMLEQTKLKWLGSLRGRLGYAWDRFLVFGTGGLEYAVDANWLVQAEYRYYDLGTYQNLAPTNGTLPYEVSNKFSTVTVGFSYKF